MDWWKFESIVIPGETIVRCVKGVSIPFGQQWDWMGVGYEGIYMTPHPNRDDPRETSKMVWVQPFVCLRDQPVDADELIYWVDGKWMTFDEVMA